MIAEKYLKYSLAKLLKEAGFNEKCKSFYDKDRKLKFWEEGHYLKNSEIDTFPNLKENNVVSAPTFEFANRWLGKKGYHVLVMPLPHYLWYVGVVCLGRPNKKDGLLGACFFEDKEVGSAEEAAEYGLRFQLKTMIRANKLIKKYGVEHFKQLRKKLEDDGVDFGDKQQE